MDIKDGSKRGWWALTGVIFAFAAAGCMEDPGLNNDVDPGFDEPGIIENEPLDTNEGVLDNDGAFEDQGVGDANVFEDENIGGDVEGDVIEGGELNDNLEIDEGGALNDEGVVDDSIVQ